MVGDRICAQRGKKQPICSVPKPVKNYLDPITDYMAIEDLK